MKDSSIILLFQCEGLLYYIIVSMCRTPLLYYCFNVKDSSIILLFQCEGLLYYIIVSMCRTPLLYYCFNVKDSSIILLFQCEGLLYYIIVSMRRTPLLYYCFKFKIIFINFSLSVSLAQGTKAIMKDVAKFIPGIGWMFLFMEYPILKRRWEDDKARLAASCKVLSDYPVNMLVS